MAVKLSALCAGRPLPPMKIPGTHFCQRLSRPQGHSVAGRIRSIEKSSDLIETRTRDLPACFIVPQPSTIPRAPYLEFKQVILPYKYCISGYYQSSCFYLKINFSDTGFCLRLQVKRTQLGRIGRASPYLRTSSIEWAQLSTFYLKTKAKSSLQNVVF
jgi:hypothetical protein